MRCYFDKFGREVSEEEATDFKGMLKDGFGISHHISMMDSATAISDAAAWASSPAGAAAIAREAYVADLNRRPAKSSAQMYADAQAGEARNATMERMLADSLPEAKAKADAAYRAMVDRLNERETRA